MVYVVVKCDVLGDQFECDANRTPVCAVSDLRELAAMVDDLTNLDGFEVWGLENIVNFDEDKRRAMDSLEVTAKVFDMPELHLITEVKRDCYGYSYRDSRLNTDRPEVIEFYEALYVM